MRKILILCVAIGTLALAYALGPDLYRKWRSERALDNARTALTQNRGREAQLSLEEALKSDPQNVAATRLMAQLLEKQQSPSSILWQRRLSQLVPGEVEPRLAWLREALGRHDAAMAKAALESFPEEQRQSALFHHLASSEALLRKDWKTAELHAAQANELDPNDPVLELDLASVYLQSPDAATVKRGQEILIALQQKEKSSVAATRVLITDALRRNDHSRAEQLSHILLPSSAANYGDHLQLLSALDGLKSPEFAAELRAVQTEAGKDPGKNIGLLEWLLVHKRITEAQAFLLELSPELLENPFIRILRANVDVATGQWPSLTKRLEEENWEESDYLRLAFLARAAKELKEDVGSRNQWALASKAAAKTPHGFYILASTVLDWPNWEDETRELLWSVADGYRYPVWALSQLHNYYLTKGDTPSLLRVAKRWKEVQPSDPVLNNFAQYSLLLNQDITQATAIARENSKRHPEDPGYSSTYAFALSQSGKNAEALQIMAGLKPEAWQIPEICAYQAILLNKARRKAEAEAFVKKAEGASLLPEEKALLEKIAAK